MKHSDSLDTLAPALVKAQAALKAVAKDSTNPHFKNRYASLDAIIDATRPILSTNGLAIVQGASSPVSDESGRLVGFAVETMLVHTTGQFITNSAIMPLAKSDPQGAGGALTYGRRYGLSALLALATEEDDDGITASVRPVATTPTPVARPVAVASSPEAVVMPFGKKKGTALGELDEATLTSTVEWATKTDAGKFAELIANCTAVLSRRSEAA